MLALSHIRIFSALALCMLLAVHAGQRLLKGIRSTIKAEFPIAPLPDDTEVIPADGVTNSVTLSKVDITKCVEYVFVDVQPKEHAICVRSAIALLLKLSIR